MVKRCTISSEKGRCIILLISRMNSLNVFYIALDAESEKIQKMERWLTKAQVNYARIPGRQFDLETNVGFYDEEKRLSRYGFGLTSGELGCFLAHRDCWARIVELSFVAVVLESDVEPLSVKRFSSLLRSIEARSDRFDLLRLHGVFERNEICIRSVENLIDEYRIGQSLGDPMGTGGYVITPDAAAVLLRLSEKVFQPVDVFLAAAWSHRQRYRVLKPYPLRVVTGPSTIGEDRRRPKQSLFTRLKIELSRAVDDLKRIVYLPFHFFR